MASTEDNKALGSNEKASLDAVQTTISRGNDHDPNTAVGPNQEVKVHSVGLADAIAKDQPKYTSRRQVHLILLMIFATLSM